MNIRTVACTLLAASLLAACGTGTVQRTVTVTAGPQGSAPISADERYLAAIRSKDSSIVAKSSDADLISLAHKACGVFESGVTVKEYVEYFASQYANDPEMLKLAAYVGGGAISFYCPQFQSQLDSL